MDREKIRDSLISAAGMPKDVLRGASVLTVLGSFEICIENFRGITEYTEELVRIRTKEGQIRITGKKMTVEYYTDTEMKITGEIHAIEFSDGRKGN